jgi:HEPN domain-containing protein
MKVNLARIHALFQRHYRKTTHFYRQAAELALKKKQLQKFGDERGNSKAVKELRQELKQLSSEFHSAK